MDKEKSKIDFNFLSEARPIHALNTVRVTQMNHIVEILSLSVEPSNLSNIKRIDKYIYQDLNTGEIKEYQTSDNRSQNIASLKKTFKSIRNLINNNFTGAANELFITLTYADNMTDASRLYQDFQVFIQRLRYKYLDIDYISVVEPQNRGAWHCHVLIRFNALKRVYVSNNDVTARLWGHGFTVTKDLKQVDNVGAYLSSYMADIEVTDENSEIILESIKYLPNGEQLKIEEKEIVEGGKKVKKRYAKGSRLHMYPPGMNIYRCSRGIKKPETEKMKYFQTKKIVGVGPPNYSRTIDVSKDGMPLNSLTYEQYNLKRPKKQ